MDRFQEMQVFIRVAERQSFTQAGDDLGIPRATVTNLIKRMELRLGTRLLERTTRTVRLTADGEAHYQRCIRLLADVEEAEASFKDAAPKGLLRVNLQGTLARVFVAPALPQFLERYPDIDLHIGDDDRFVDLIREGVDCVLRVGHLHDSSMIGRRVAELPQVTVASPAYFEKWGMPESIGDPPEFKGLTEHRAVNFVSSSSGRPLPFDFTHDGKVVQLPMTGTISVTGVEMYTAAALSGLGLVQVPRYRIATELAAGSLIEVLRDFPPPPMPVSVLYPQNRQLSLRVRVFTQWMTQLFKSAAV